MTPTIYWRPDGCIAMDIFPYDRPCGQKLVVCADSSCPHKDECEAYDPELDVQRFLVKISLKPGEIEKHTSIALMNSLNVPLCSLCKKRNNCDKRARVSRKNTPDSCKDYDEDRHEVALLVRKRMDRLWLEIAHRINDYNVLKKYIERKSEDKGEQPNNSSE